MQNIIQGAHFVEDGFKSRATFMDDASYGIALDNIVFACVDIVLLNESQEILLGRRVAFPHPNWWIIGGRMLPGENFEQAASRNVSRELGLRISPSRFQYLCTFSLVWAKRAQPPQENGTHTISITMIITLRNREVALIETKPEEYESLKWFKLQEIKNSCFHPALIMCAKNIKTALEQSGK